MKRLAYLAAAIAMMACFSGHVFAQEEKVDYKAEYEKQMKMNADTMDVINGVVKWLKEHNYEKYPNAKDAVDDALDSLNNADNTKKKAEALAAKDEWQKASGWATQYWQYLVKVATEGLRAKKMVEDYEAAAQTEK